MSEIKVNTIKPAAGSEVTVTAQVLGVPGTEPNHFATVSQLGVGGAIGISRAEAQSLIDTGVAIAKIYSDDKDEEQNTQISLDIAAAKTEAIAVSNTYTDGKISEISTGMPLHNNSWVGGDPTGLSSQPALGCAIPLLISYNDACLIPSGTWFVFLSIQENDEDGDDEDNAFVMSKVWTVAPGNYLKILCGTQGLGSANHSRVFYRNDSDTTTQYTAANRPTSDEPGDWIEFTKGVTGQRDNSMKTPYTVEQLQTRGSSGVVWGEGNTRLGTGAGYAIRIG